MNTYQHYEPSGNSMQASDIFGREYIHGFYQSVLPKATFCFRKSVTYVLPSKQGAMFHDHKYQMQKSFMELHSREGITLINARLIAADANRGQNKVIPSYANETEWMNGPLQQIEHITSRCIASNLCSKVQSECRPTCHLFSWSTSHGSPQTLQINAGTVP
jgi:hypothetical protein